MVVADTLFTPAAGLPDLGNDGDSLVSATSKYGQHRVRC